MANTHHTGIPKLQWSFNYPPCTPSLTIVADKNPFCLGHSVTFTPTFACVDDVTITAYGWVVNGSIQSTSAEPFVTNTLTNGNSVYMFFITSTGQTYFSNLIVMQEKTEGCITEIKYGLLYNWYAATDARNITSAGDFVVPSNIDQSLLIDYFGGAGTTSLANQRIKAIGQLYWTVGNGEGLYNFNAKGAGQRDPEIAQTFANLKESTFYWSSDNVEGREGYAYTIMILDIQGWIFYNSESLYQYGMSIRLVRPATTPELSLTDGTSCAPYVGNDGKTYPTVKIGTQVWLAANLAETKFRNGDAIPEVTDNAAWAALTTGALCAYNNSWDNV